MPFNQVRRVIVDHTKVVGVSDLTSFPFMFNGIYAGGGTGLDLRGVAHGGSVENANGYDIVFSSDSGGATLLDWEVKTYDATTGEIVAWIKLPTLHVAADTIIYISVGDASITTFQGNVNGTWDTNFHAVHHFPGSGASVSSTVIDSTVKGNNLPNISGGSNFLVPSPLGLAMSGGGQYVYGTVTTDIPTAPPLTLECWFKQSSSGIESSSCQFRG